MTTATCDGLCPANDGLCPANDQPPTMGQLLIRRFGREMFKEGRPITDCRTTDERIGWHEAQEAQAPASNDNGK